MPGLRESSGNYSFPAQYSIANPGLSGLDFCYTMGSWEEDGLIAGVTAGGCQFPDPFTTLDITWKLA